MSDSVRPHRWQPTRLPRPWDSPGKNTGAGCHFLLQCMKVKSDSEVAQSCPTLRDPMDCSLPGSTVHVIFQARVMEWGCHFLLFYNMRVNTITLFLPGKLSFHYTVYGFSYPSRDRPNSLDPLLWIFLVSFSPGSNV